VKVERKSEYPVSDAGAKAATGKSLEEWFKLLDKKGGVELGRREIGNWLVGEHKVDPWWSATINCEYEIARGALEKDGKPKGYTICATKSIKASPESCFAAFASAKALDGWFGPEHEASITDGGHWRNGDGNRASIKKATPGKVIRGVCEDEDLSQPTPIEIKFQPAGAKCTVMVTIDRLQTRAEADGYRAAWGAALDRLKGVLEA
jgi:uncharacterized protein YndB with AHSA1/START domain